jgi:hypothetical protein
MIFFLQAIVAFFTVVGLFETVWQILLFFTRRALKANCVRILVSTDETTDPAFLPADLDLLKNRLTACRNLQVWLICPKGAPQEKICRFVAEQDESVRVVTPEELPEAVEIFSEEW